jgi:2-dehydropantoate 2-reductase
VSERIWVIGGGVIGSLFAAHLSRVADVTLLSRRAEHAAAVSENGIRVSGRAEFIGRPEATTDPAGLREASLAIVATKASDVEAAAAQLDGRLVDGAAVMTVQNGLGAEEVVRSRGPWPQLSAVTFMSGTKLGDDQVEYVLDTPTWLAPYEDSPFELAEQTASLIVESGLKAEAMPDLEAARWSKLIFNATVNSVAALTLLPHDHHFAEVEQPTDLGHLVRGLIDEGKQIAAAAGIELGEDPWEMNVLATRRGSRHYPSMLEDVEAHRRTEVDFITGALVREADRRGVEAPLLTAVYRLVKAREASYL